LNTVDLPTFGSPTIPTFMNVIVSSGNNPGGQHTATVR
jgi:hypothetical protein